MKRSTLLVASVVLILPAMASAGEATVGNVPTLGEVGLVVLGAGLAVAGVASFLRKKRS